MLYHFTMPAFRTTPRQSRCFAPALQRGRADMEFWVLLALAVLGFAGGWWWAGSIWWGLAGLVVAPLGVGLLVFAISWVVTRGE